MSSTISLYCPSQPQKVPYTDAPKRQHPSKPNQDSTEAPSRIPNTYVNPILIVEVRQVMLFPISSRRITGHNIHRSTAINEVPPLTALESVRVFLRGTVTVEAVAAADGVLLEFEVGVVGGILWWADGPGRGSDPCVDADIDGAGFALSPVEGSHGVEKRDWWV